MRAVGVVVRRPLACDARFRLVTSNLSSVLTSSSCHSFSFVCSLKCSCFHNYKRIKLQVKLTFRFIAKQLGNARLAFVCFLPMLSMLKSVYLGSHYFNDVLPIAVTD